MCEAGRERAEICVGCLESWTTLGWDNVEEKEQQKWRWDGSKALQRGRERGRVSDRWPREEPSQLVMCLD